MLARLSCASCYKGGKFSASLVIRVPASEVLLPRGIHPIKTGELVAVENIQIASYFSQGASHDHEHHSRIWLLEPRPF